MARPVYMHIFRRGSADQWAIHVRKIQQKPIPSPEGMTYIGYLHALSSDARTDDFILRFLTQMSNTSKFPTVDFAKLREVENMLKEKVGPDFYNKMSWDIPASDTGEQQSTEQQPLSIDELKEDFQVFKTYFEKFYMSLKSPTMEISNLYTQFQKYNKVVNNPEYKWSEKEIMKFEKWLKKSRDILDSYMRGSKSTNNTTENETKDLVRSIVNDIYKIINSFFDKKDMNSDEEWEKYSDIIMGVIKNPIEFIKHRLDVISQSLYGESDAIKKEELRKEQEKFSKYYTLVKNNPDVITKELEKIFKKDIYTKNKQSKNNRQTKMLPSGEDDVIDIDAEVVESFSNYCTRTPSKSPVIKEDTKPFIRYATDVTSFKVFLEGVAGEGKGFLILFITKPAQSVLSMGINDEFLNFITEAEDPSSVHEAYSFVIGGPATNSDIATLVIKVDEKGIQVPVTADNDIGNEFIPGDVKGAGFSGYFRGEEPEKEDDTGVYASVKSDIEDAYGQRTVQPKGSFAKYYNTKDAQ